MLEYFEVAMDSIFVDIATTSLEVRIQYKVNIIRKTMVLIEDGSEVGNVWNMDGLNLNYLNGAHSQTIHY